MTTTDYLESLQNDMQTLKDNVEAKGVEVSDSDNFTTLANKVADIETGGGDVSDYVGGTISVSSYYRPAVALIKKLPKNSVVVSGTSMQNAFRDCSSLTELPYFDTSSIVEMKYAFYGCSSLKTIPLINTSNVTDMNNCFFECKSLETVPLFNTSKVTNAGYMFGSCYNLANVPVLDMSSATFLSYMFANSKGKLTDESLNNILIMCINASSFTGTKKLSTLFGSGSSINNYTSRIPTLPNYQDFLDAGWTIQ